MLPAMESIFLTDMQKIVENYICPRMLQIFPEEATNRISFRFLTFNYQALLAAHLPVESSTKAKASILCRFGPFVQLQQIASKERMALKDVYQTCPEQICPPQAYLAVDAKHLIVSLNEKGAVHAKINTVSDRILFSLLHGAAQIGACGPRALHAAVLLKQFCPAWKISCIELKSFPYPKASPGLLEILGIPEAAFAREQNHVWVKIENSTGDSCYYDPWFDPSLIYTQKALFTHLGISFGARLIEDEITLDFCERLMTLHRMRSNKHTYLT